MGFNHDEQSVNQADELAEQTRAKAVRGQGQTLQPL